MPTTTNPISITYGDVTVGGESGTYQLHGVHTIDKSFTALRMTFEVVVVADTIEDLKAAADALEEAFSKRDQGLTIAMGDVEWEYEFGTDLLRSTASLAKTTDPLLNRGSSRAYLCTIEGELPASDKQGLRDLEVQVAFSASRQRTVTMTGTYTAYEGETATERYFSGFEAEVPAIMTTIGGVFELVDESYSADRLDQVLRFSRQYLEVADNQASGTLNHPDIRDHRVTLTRISSHPGDSREAVFRLHRVAANYDSSIDLGANPRTVWNNTIKPYLEQRFQQEFFPQTWTIEDERASFDPSRGRVSGTIVFLYQHQNGQEVVEVAESVAYRESRTIDYTPLHDQNEYAANADAGWAVRERIWTRSVVVMGDETPKKRIGERAQVGPAGAIDTIAGQEGVDARDDGQVHGSGWNVIANESTVTPRWIGLPSGQQMRLSVLVETVVERWHEAAAAGSPTTGG